MGKGDSVIEVPLHDEFTLSDIELWTFRALESES